MTSRRRYWRENYDLSFIIERDWEQLREKLDGKIHLYCGTMDNFYLNNAVYLLEARLRALSGHHGRGESESAVSESAVAAKAKRLKAPADDGFTFEVMQASKLYVNIIHA